MPQAKPSIHTSGKPVEAKQKFIAQIMTSKSPVRSCEDVDETSLSYAEIKALCAGNPLIAEKMNLDIDIARLRMLKADYQSQRFRLEDDLLKNFPKKIAAINERIADLESDIKLYETFNKKASNIQMSGGAASVTAKFAGMTILGKTFSEKEPAAKALLDACKELDTASDSPVGQYMGFDMYLDFDSFSKNFNLSLRASATYKVELGSDSFGNITRINNALSSLPERLAETKSNLESTLLQQQAANEELDKPFELASELAEKEQKLAEINTQLDIGSEQSPDSADENNADIDDTDRGSDSQMSGSALVRNIADYNAGRRTEIVGDTFTRDEGVAV